MLLHFMALYLIVATLEAVFFDGNLSTNILKGGLN